MFGRNPRSTRPASIGERRQVLVDGPAHSSSSASTTAFQRDVHRPKSRLARGRGSVSAQSDRPGLQRSKITSWKGPSGPPPIAWPDRVGKQFTPKPRMSLSALVDEVTRSSLAAGRLASIVDWFASTNRPAAIRCARLRDVGIGSVPGREVVRLRRISRGGAGRQQLFQVLPIVAPAALLAVMAWQHRSVGDGAFNNLRVVRHLKAVTCR